MSDQPKRPYAEMIVIAENVKSKLEPHCERISIAGSCRRKCDMTGDIEIVLIPKDYEVGIFASGIATVIDTWKFGVGTLPCKYAKRFLKDGTQVDIFIVTPETWGLLFAIRTGSSKYSHLVLANGWKEKGYKSEGGVLYPIVSESGYSEGVKFREEKDLFDFLGIPYCEPENRSI